LGGVIAALANRAAARSDEPPRRGLLFAAGLITGEALMGIVLAIPIALGAFWPGLSPDPFLLFEAPPLGGWPGIVIVGVVGWLLYLTAREPSRETKRGVGVG